EVVGVDNGSTGRTAGAARRAGVTVVSEPRRGYGSACLAGLAHLSPDPPAIVAFLDADLSDDPRQLPELLGPLLEGRADLVIGSRARAWGARAAPTPGQVYGH